MKNIFYSVLVTLLVGSSLFAKPGDSAKKESDKSKFPPVIQLPADAKAVVLSLDYTGGRIRRTNKSPLLSILADGTIKVADTRGKLKDTVSHISPAELQTLLRSIIHTNSAFKLNGEDIKEEVRQAAKVPQPGADGTLRPRRNIRIMDGSTTVIRINANGKQHEIKFYSLSHFARQFGDVENLGKLNNISKLLQHEIMMAHAGGKDGLERLLEAANLALKLKYPQAKPLTAMHLTSATRRQSGARHYHFMRHKPGADGKPQSAIYTIVKIIAPPTGEPTITVQAKLK